MSDDPIIQRREFSEKKLGELRGRIAAEAPELKQCPNLCVYATGSFARLDASQHSDLDLFFVSTPGTAPVTRIQQTLINADLIRLCRNLGLPDFSGDALYLQIHQSQELIEELGSQKEDYANLFTARLLLLLESTLKCAPGMRPRNAIPYDTFGEPFRSARHCCSNSAGVR
jgi:hypothetical protein